MNASSPLRRTSDDLLSAIQFLTRVPVPSPPYTSDSLSRAVRFFPLVGLLIGSGAALFHHILAPHLPRAITAFLLLLYLVLITGCLHEDGLADAADGFGGGTTREKVLLILRDSRIGTYGAAALILSLTSRILLLATLPPAHIAQYLIAAAVLCRWTTLPLSYFLPSARSQSSTEHAGQGSRIANLTTRSTLIFGTLFSFAVVILLLHAQAVAPICAAVAIAAVTGLYYRRRIGGVTGDCFGATNQLTEIGVYLCGVWTL
jgi:adenosylcobinamide-GDP ribazoletransferase